MAIDLHIHSTYSDGTLTPTRIVEMAKAKGLSAIALTDHDTTEGVKEATEAGGRLGVEVISGIELSVVDEGMHIHMLGYHFKPDFPELSVELAVIQNSRKERNSKIIHKLRDLSIDIDLQEVEKKSGVGQTGRPHIAQVLVEKGVVRDIDEAFSRYLKKGAVAYMKRYVLTAAVALRLIRDAGGLPILAHPASIDISLARIPALLGRLVPLGLAGIETYYPTHSRKNMKKLKALAQRYDLVVTGGSDYHGDIRPGTSLAGGKNVRVPLEVLQQMKDKLIELNSSALSDH